MTSVPTGRRAKRTGAYYTDAAVAAFLTRWAVRAPTDRVLDPSFGGGVFLRSAAKRLGELGGAAAGQVFGVEIDPAVCGSVAADLAAAHALSRESLLAADFFSVDPERLPAFEAVIGNPPFIRFQRLGGASRARALERAAAAGVALNGLASSWAPFVVHSTTFLKEGGRLAMVLPMELGHAAYARPVLDHLTRRFARVTLLTFRRPLFAALDQDTLLLLAEAKGAAFERLAWCDLEGPEALAGFGAELPATRALDHRALVAGRDRLVARLVEPRALELYRELAERGATARLGELAEVGIGYVTGANAFFHLSPAEARSRRLPAGVTVPTVFRGRAFGGSRFTADDWRAATAAGDAGYLFSAPRERRPGARARAYIAQGEAQGVHRGYKCRRRSPWYAVPGVRVPDAFLTYMSGRRPALVANEAGASAPNTLHLVRLRAGAELSGEGLAALWRSSLTELSAEIEGHALGGGMLKLEPSEAKRVLLPLPDAPPDGLASEVDALLRRGEPAAAGARVDRAVLVERLGLSSADCRLLTEAAARLAARRRKSS